MQKAGMEEEALRKDLEIRKKHADDKLKMRLRNKIHGATEVDDDDDDIVENGSSSMALEDSLISNDDQSSFISNTDMSNGSIMSDDD